MGVELCRAAFGSPLYRQSLRLRRDILRAPLGLVLSEDDTADDATEHLFCAVGEGRLIACVQLRPLGEGGLKLRQMAVVEEMRGRGIGASLVRFAEDWARSQGFVRIIMHARATAIGFYEKLGYETVGEPFEECTIAHIVMAKTL